MSGTDPSDYILASSLLPRGETDAWMFLSSENTAKFGLAVVVSVNQPDTRESFIHDISVTPYGIQANAAGSSTSFHEDLTHLAKLLHDELRSIATVSRSQLSQAEGKQPFPSCSSVNPLGTEELNNVINSLTAKANAFLRDKAGLTDAERSVTPPSWFPHIITLGVLDLGVSLHDPEASLDIFVGIGGDTFSDPSPAPTFRAEAGWENLLGFAKSVTEKLKSQSDELQQALKSHYIASNIRGPLVEGDTRDTSGDTKLVLDFVYKHVLLESMEGGVDIITVETTALDKGDVDPTEVLTMSRLVFRDQLEYPFKEVEYVIEGGSASSHEGDDEDEDTTSAALGEDGEVV